MKFLLALVFFPFFAQAQDIKQLTTPEAFSIVGTIKGLPDSTMVYLSRPGQSSDILATAYVQKEKFTLFGKIADGDIYQISFIGFPDLIPVFLTPANLKITGDVKSLKTAAVTGSAAHADFQFYNSRFDPLKEKLEKLVNTINKSSDAHQRDSLISVFEKHKAKVLEQVDFFLEKKATSAVTPFIVYVTSPLNANTSALEEKFNKLTPAAKKSFYGRELEKMIIIDFTQSDTTGNPFSLSSYRGKYVLVDFWASWCGPCRLENPNVVSAFNNYKGKNFTIVGVSLDMNKEKWMQAIHADNLTWTHVSDLKYWQNEVARSFNIQSIPANMLIDPKGKVIARNLRGEALNEMLGKLLK